MKYNNTHAFTLIEFMVVITIVFMITIATYIPYAHHQKKVLLKQAAREVSQSLSESRNLAIHGLNTGSGNVNVGLFFGSSAKELVYYSSTGAMDLINIGSADVYKIKDLPQGIQIDSVDGAPSDALFVFERIKGDLQVFPTHPDELSISLSYKGATTPVLQKELRYYTQSYITDY